MDPDPRDTPEHKQLLEDFLSAQMAWDEVRPDRNGDREHVPAEMNGSQVAVWDAYQASRDRLNRYRTAHDLESL
ncbi:hypothetical protein AB3X52_08800 [Nocardioides sp. DS6]|uniref:Uncharacterized protein n=1 Tax=Nocardioides eburneus TaxID=3231482 RepID=A0ABV3SXQ3_9ACTN